MVAVSGMSQNPQNGVTVCPCLDYCLFTELHGALQLLVYVHNVYCVLAEPLYPQGGRHWKKADDQGSILHFLTHKT